MFRNSGSLNWCNLDTRIRFRVRNSISKESSLPLLILWEPFIAYHSIAILPQRINVLIMAVTELKYSIFEMRLRRGLNHKSSYNIEIISNRRYCKDFSDRKATCGALLPLTTFFDANLFAVSQTYYFTYYPKLSTDAKQSFITAELSFFQINLYVSKSLLIVLKWCNTTS